VTITINGADVDITDVSLHTSLLEFLRQSGRTGSKVGCNEGDCGACTILLVEPDGPPRAINGCLALVHSLAGREVITAEGLSAGTGALHPAQRAMIDWHGSQCGYCTPGFVCSLAEAAARGITSDPAAVADQLCGNLCRCTGYRAIREAAASIPPTPVPSRRASVPNLPSASSGYHLPQTIAEALALKARFANARYIAGATELAVLINKQDLRPDALISLEHIPELSRIQKTGTHWQVGAAASLTEIEAALMGEYPSLDSMFRLFASRQIRHRATLGGNLVTASPIGDSAPALLALDATLTLVSSTGERAVPIANFFTGYRATVLQDDELLASVHIPRDPPGRSEFFKVSKRREMDISTISAAICIATDDAGVITHARLAFGGVAAFPTRATKTENALTGRPIAEASSACILAILAREFRPISDLRGSAEHRSMLVRELFLKYLAGEPPPSFQPPVIATRSSLGAAGSPHESARGHVTGEALYTHDVALRRGALHVWPVQSKEARASLIRLDTARAAAAPGVRAVLTAADIPGLNNTGPSRHDEPLFAGDEIQFHGQLLAAVIADTPEQARQAAAWIDIESAPLPPLLGIENAIREGSFHTDPHFLVRGDIAAALAESPAILEGTLHLGGQEHFYLETQAALAEPDGEGGVHIHSSTQHPSETQAIVAEVLGWPRNRVVVECPRMGGGFGGKESQANPWAAVCALGALKTGKPVALQLDRDDDMESTGKRHPFFARFKVGYQPDGRLHAADIELYSDGGWSLDLSRPVNDRALFHLDNAYFIPNVRFRGQVCKTNATSHTAFRGFGGPQGMVVIEDILARIAAALELPSDEVRARNFYHDEGETNTTHYGERIGENRIGRIWSELLDSSDFHARRDAISLWNSTSPHHKRGMAITPVKFGISFTLKHYNQAGALVLIYKDGSVQVNHGGTEMGQGLHTKILGVAMRGLGVSADRIRLMHTRTDKVPNTSATAASSGSDLNGMAVADACGILRARLATLAAEKFKCQAQDIVFRDDHVHGPGGNPLAFQELTALAYTRRIPLFAAGFYATPDLEWDWEIGKGKPFHYFAFGAAVTEVEIDGFTGIQHIRRVDILHDVGDSLNPAIDLGQIEGGYLQGVGWLTNEELAWNNNGKLLTHSASTYAIPSISDAPLDFRVDLLARAAQAGTIHGSKAVGEPPLMLAISAREALRDAIQAFGRPGTDLPSPLTGEGIKNAIGALPLP